MPRKHDGEPSYSPYSDIDLSRWKEYEDIWTDSLWLFSSRDRSNGHKYEYHGNFVPQIAAQLLQRFTKSGELVLDLFLGSATTAIEASSRGRLCVGVELKPELVESARNRLPVKTQTRIVQGDSRLSTTMSRIRRAIKSLGPAHAHLLVLHPPYWDIIKFSELEGDLSSAASVDEFLDMFGRVARNGYELLAPGRFAALVIGDKYAAGELVPLGFLCMQKMNEVGFRTKSIIVKNIEGNEIGKGKANNLWRYRALVGGFYIFKHEYVMVFQKPG